MEPKAFAVLGLALTLLGSGLLFFYGYPTKTIGNTMIMGNMAVTVSGNPAPEDDPAVWQAAASRYLARSKRLNQAGFALIALGTLLQIIAALTA